jgi:hypothetical protein
VAEHLFAVGRAAIAVFLVLVVVFVSIIRATKLDVIGDGILTVHVSTRFEAGLGKAWHAPGLFVPSRTFINACIARIFAFATLLIVTLVVVNLVAVAVAVADA